MSNKVTKYVIKTPVGVVSGFSAAWGVQWCNSGSGYEKLFASVKTAQNFIDKYADAGYGLGCADSTIEPVQVPAK